MPELTIDSDDARKINNELETEARKSEYGAFYRSKIFDGFLTVFLETSYTGGKSYKIYTVDLNTGKQLTNDDIASLYTDDKDEFLERLREEHKNQHPTAYQCGYTQFETDLFNKELKTYYDPLDEEVLNRYADALSFDNIFLGYYGEGTLICSASFNHYAGAESSIHIFEFEY